MTQKSSDFRVPLAVADKLEAVRARAWKVRLATALVGGLVVLLAAMGLAMGIDRWATLYSPTWRSMLTLAALGATGVTLVAWILAAWRYVNRVDRVAMDVDRSLPNLEERWSTVAQLTTPEKTRDVHPAMFRQVAEEANKYSPDVDPLRVVRLNNFTRAAWCLTAVSAILVCAAVMDSHRTSVLFKRFWLPMANISATEINNLSKHDVVARGESLEIVAELAGSPVKNATLFLAPDGDDEQAITLVPRGDQQNRLTHRVRTVKEPLKYRLRAGDGQTEWQEVAVADRPELGAATLKVTPPEYTQQEPQEFDKLPRRTTALVGSTLEFAFKPRAAVAKMYLDLMGGEKKPLLVDADGWYRWEVKLSENIELSPILEEEHGLTNRRPPQCSVQARPDKPPVVRILTPNEEIAVRPDDTVPVTFEAKDDVRVGSAELVVYDEGRPGEQPRVLDTLPVPLGDQEGDKEVKATVELDLSKYKVSDGAQLSFAVRVREDRSLAPGEPVENTVADAVPAKPQAEMDAAKPQTKNVVPEAYGYMSPDGKTGGISPSGLERMNEETGERIDPNSANLAEAAAAKTQAEDQIESEALPSNDTSASSEKLADESLSAKPQAAAKTQADPPQPPAPPSEPSAVSKAIAEAMPDKLKELAASAGGDDAVSERSSGDASPGSENEANKETTTDRQSLNTAVAEATQPPSTASQPGEDASNSRTEQVAQESQQESETASDSHAEQVAQGSQQQGEDASEDQSEQVAQDSQQESETASENQSEQVAQDSQQPGEDASGDQNEQANSDRNRGEARRGNQSQQTASSQNNQSSQPQMSPGSTPPPMQGGANQLDIQKQSQSAMSNRMRLKIDQWAGSFAGQERMAVEMAIAPELLKLDELLEKAENLSRNVLNSVDAGNDWQAAQGRDIDSAGQQIANGLQIVEDLEVRTHNTPYAFVGLQLVNISKGHMQPARREFWKALQTDGEDRVTATRDGWQHTVRSRELLAELTTKFETAQQEYALADTIEKVKKMYQIFVENSMALLSPEDESDDGGYRRKRVEFEIDEEYMARLKEVLEMRNNMRAELAKILADDPRLLRRFLDAQENRRRVLRHELEEMIESQRELNREVLAWSEADETLQPQLQEMMLQRHTETAADLAVDAAVLQDKFETWLPLAQQVNNADVQTAARLLQDVASTTQELSADAESFIAQNQQAKIKESGEEIPPLEGETAPTPTNVTVDDIATDAQELHDQLTNLEVSLRQLGLMESSADMAVFAANRLLETRNLIALSEEWIRQLKHHQEGNYHNAAEVEQYRLAMQTDTLAGKLANLEQQMAGLLQRADNKIPEKIALKARELLASLDEQAAPNQLSAVYALRRNQVPRAVERQETALAGIQKAAKDYDEMIKLAIEELDKMPVQDPIASLLQDPTLDELLAGLEQEFPIEEILGIPNRPSNLQIAGDFMRMGGDNALSTGANRRMLMNQLLQRQRMRQRRLNSAYRRAVARALQEVDEIETEDEELELARETVDWNVLLSQLGDDLQQGADKAPPERYRRAIEQYFRQISQPEKSGAGVE